MYINNLFFTAISVILEGKKKSSPRIGIVKMIVIPVDIECLVQCAVIALLFETMRMVLAYGLARPSSEVLKLETDKFEAQVEISKIKSVQLEFVKHSLLNRKVISIEKKLEGIQAQYAPRVLKVKKIFRVVRVSFILTSFYPNRSSSFSYSLLSIIFIVFSLLLI
jgi:hypothetical protein